ncbi:hypothetical protein ACSSS7_000148 [Eimeria intestinalis]
MIVFHGILRLLLSYKFQVYTQKQQQQQQQQQQQEQQQQQPLKSCRRVIERIDERRRQRCLREEAAAAAAASDQLQQQQQHQQQQPLHTSVPRGGSILQPESSGVSNASDSTAASLRAQARKLQEEALLNRDKASCVRGAQQSFRLRVAEMREKEALRLLAMADAAEDDASAGGPQNPEALSPLGSEAPCLPSHRGPGNGGPSYSDSASFSQVANTPRETLHRVRQQQQQQQQQQQGLQQKRHLSPLYADMMSTSAAAAAAAAPAAGPVGGAGIGAACCSSRAQRQGDMCEGWKAAGIAGHGGEARKRSACTGCWSEATTAATAAAAAATAAAALCGCSRRLPTPHGGGHFVRPALRRQRGLLRLPGRKDHGRPFFSLHALRVCLQQQQGHTTLHQQQQHHQPQQQQQQHPSLYGDPGTTQPSSARGSEAHFYGSEQQQQRMQQQQQQQRMQQQQQQRMQQQHRMQQQRLPETPREEADMRDLDNSVFSGKRRAMEASVPTQADRAVLEAAERLRQEALLCRDKARCCSGAKQRQLVSLAELKERRAADMFSQVSACDNSSTSSSQHPQQQHIDYNGDQQQQPSYTQLYQQPEDRKAAGNVRGRVNPRGDSGIFNR